MSFKSATSPNLPKSRVRTGANDVRQSEMELDDIALERAKRREERLRTNGPEALRIFAGGVERCSKESSFAAKINVSKSILSEIKSGKRILKGSDFLDVIDPEEPEATDWVMQQLAAKAGGTYRRNRKRTREQAERALGRAAAAIPEILAGLRARAAQLAETDEQDLQAALSDESEDLAAVK